MGTVLLASQSSPDPEVVERVATVLRAGGVAVLPTDSVYGICCAAMPGNPAHGRIFDIKRRDRAQDAAALCGRRLRPRAFWPGRPAWAPRFARALLAGRPSVVVRASELLAGEYAQPSEGGPTVALRVPGSELDRAIVPGCGRPARPRRAPTRTAPPPPPRAPGLEPAVAGAVDLVVDAGPPRWAFPPRSSTPPRTRRASCVPARSLRRTSFSPCADLLRLAVAPLGPFFRRPRPWYPRGAQPLHSRGAFMRVAIASDHAGFVQKDSLADYLRSLGHEVVDCGPATDARCDYPDFADKVAASSRAARSSAASSSAGRAWASP